MGDINEIPTKLRKRIFDFYKHFFEIHSTEKTKMLLLMDKKYLFLNLLGILNVINHNITWGLTKEGYLYYYTLNLRWAIGIAYICHEFDSKYDDICLRKANEFVNYRSSSYLVGIDYKYHKVQKIYKEKIKIMKEIFGNKK